MGESPQDEKGRAAVGSHSPVHRRLQKLEQFHQTFCEICEALNIANEPIPPQQLNEFQEAVQQVPHLNEAVPILIQPKSALDEVGEFDYQRSAGEVGGS